MTPKSLSLFDLVPGKVVADRYEIKEARRQGGMSTTFAVEDSETGDELELQAMPSALFEGHDQAVEFCDAMREWTAIKGSGVLEVRDVIDLEDGSMILVADSPFGVSLRSWLNENQRMSQKDVCTLGVLLLEGLNAIHAAGLVHGDIKPSTIHIEGSGEKMRVLLVDGGITTALWNAKQLGDKTALIGTPFYAPIEQFGGDSPDVRSDVYNLATVLFELVTGVIPWAGSSFLEIFQAKLEKASPSMHDRAPDVEVSPELEQAIIGGLMAARNQRYATAEEFRQRLLAVSA